jgi:hypothetical protein
MKNEPLAGIMMLLNEITTCRDAGAVSTTAIMVYIGIDVMAFLAMPPNQESQKRQDFIDWVDTYLKADSKSTYQYDGRDVYGARCSMVHTYAIEADYHQKNLDVKKFGYHDGGLHVYNPAIDKKLVMIGINSLVNDFMKGMESFVLNMKKDTDLRRRVAARVPKIIEIFPVGS